MRFAIYSRRPRNWNLELPFTGNSTIITGRVHWQLELSSVNCVYVRRWYSMYLYPSLVVSPIRIEFTTIHLQREWYGYKTYRETFERICSGTCFKDWKQIIQCERIGRNDCWCLSVRKKSQRGKLLIVILVLFPVCRNLIWWNIKIF